jgi:opacity protein-like surface antigen
MKLTKSIVAIIALSSMSFAGGDIIEPVFEQETVVVPVEPVYVAPTPAPAPTPVVVKAAPVVVAPVVAEALGLYIAGGITDIAARSGDRANLFSDELDQDRQVGLTGRLGYDFMDNLGAELRGTVAVSGEDEGIDSFQQVGAYLKPNYDITDTLNLYGLVGVSSANLADPKDMDSQETGLSYGLGLDYSVSNTISVFTDVVNYLKDDDTNSLWGLTIGAGYQF